MVQHHDTWQVVTSLGKIDGPGEMCLTIAELNFLRNNLSSCYTPKIRYVRGCPWGLRAENQHAQSNRHNPPPAIPPDVTSPEVCPLYRPHFCSSGSNPLATGQLKLCVCTYGLEFSTILHPYRRSIFVFRKFCHCFDGEFDCGYRCVSSGSGASLGAVRRNFISPSPAALPARFLKKSAAVSTTPTFSATAAAIHWFNDTPSSLASRWAAFLMERGSFNG